MIQFGDDKIKEIYVGSDKIKEVYHGADLVWKGGMKKGLYVLGTQTASGAPRPGDAPVLTYVEGTENVTVLNSMSCIIDGALYHIKHGDSGVYLTKIGDRNDWIDGYFSPSSGNIGQTDGDGYYIALSENGELWGMGQNNYRQLGITGADRTDFTQISTIKMDKLSVGDGLHSLSIAQSGRLYSWGTSSQGATGRGTGTYSIGTVGSFNFTDIGAVRMSSIAVRDNGWIYGFGRNAEYNLGLPNAQNYTNVTRIGSFIEPGAKVFAGVNSSFLIFPEKGGEMYSVGLNHYGQLGLGDNFVKTSFQKVDGSGWSHAAPLRYSALAIKDGQLYEMGVSLGSMALEIYDDVTYTPRILDSNFGWRSVVPFNVDSVLAWYDGDN